MKEYNSRVHIKVRDNESWSKLFDMDLEPYNLYIPADDVFDVRGNDFVLDSDWSVYEEDLAEFVREVVDILGTDCIIIADTTDTTKESFEYISCYFGDEVVSMYLEANGDKINEIFYDTDIYEVADWVNNAMEYGLEVSSAEKDYLADFGYEVN